MQKGDSCLFFIFFFGGGEEVFGVKTQLVFFVGNVQFKYHSSLDVGNITAAGPGQQKSLVKGILCFLCHCHLLKLLCMLVLYAT